jgi:hypothetical protein
MAWPFTTTPKTPRAILIYTRDGDDTVSIDRKLDVPLLIDTGDGNDNVTGGTGSELMILGRGQRCRLHRAGRRYRDRRRGAPTTSSAAPRKT